MWGSLEPPALCPHPQGPIKLITEGYEKHGEVGRVELSPQGLQNSILALPAVVGVL